MKLLDYYSQFRQAIHTCKCGWRGPGGWMNNGSYTSLGIDKHCPKCGAFHTFAKFSVIAGNDDPDDWPPVG